MEYIFLCILANIGIFVSFRLFPQYRINTMQAIVVNYLICVVTGMFFIGPADLLGSFKVNEPWVIVAVMLGVVFVFIFYLMAITTQKMGMTVSTIAAKMSLVIPVGVSIWVFAVQTKEYTYLNYMGILLAVAAILMASIKNGTDKTSHSAKGGSILFPIAIFILAGSIDSTINYTNLKYLTTENEPLFPIVIFASSFLVGSIFIMATRSKLETKNVIAGALLGVVNYFSVYFLVKSLSAFNNDGSMVYPVLNVGIILFSSLVSVIVFRERLLPLNKIGLVVAVMAVVFIFYQEIGSYF